MSCRLDWLDEAESRIGNLEYLRRFWHQLDMAVTVFADNLVANVLHCGTQFIFAVRALSIKGIDDHRRGVDKGLAAVFALHF